MLPAQNIPRDLAGTSLAKAKETDLLAAKEPGIAIVSVGAPAGFIGVFDRGLAIIFDQLLARRF